MVDTAWWRRCRHWMPLLSSCGFGLVMVSHYGVGDKLRRDRPEVPVSPAPAFWFTLEHTVQKPRESGPTSPLAVIEHC